jgi:hypothetical protein
MKVVASLSKRMCNNAGPVRAPASNQIKSNQIKSNQIKSNQIKSKVVFWRVISGPQELKVLARELSQPPLSRSTY